MPQHRLFSRAVDLAEKELGAKENGHWLGREVRAAGRALEETREAAVERLKLVRYFYRHAHWLQERFPQAKLRDVEGLVKLASREELEKKSSPSPINAPSRTKPTANSPCSRLGPRHLQADAPRGVMRTRQRENRLGAVASAMGALAAILAARSRDLSVNNLTLTPTPALHPQHP